jgi:hypothetical protein
MDVIVPDHTFEDSQHDLIEVPLFTDVEQHLGQLPAESASVKLWGNVEFIAVRELGLMCFANNRMAEVIVDRPINHCELFLFFESEGCESDDPG